MEFLDYSACTPGSLNTKIGSRAWPLAPKTATVEHVGKHDCYQILNLLGYFFNSFYFLFFFIYFIHLFYLISFIYWFIHLLVHLQEINSCFDIVVPLSASSVALGLFLSLFILLSSSSITTALPSKT